MPYLALDDNFAGNPKIHKLSDRAFRLHVVALCHCSKHLTDGFVSVSSKLWGELGSNIRRTGELVRAGLWDEVEGGWQIHDYLDWNASAAQIKEKQRRDRLRKRTKSLNDSARNPDGNGDTFRVDSTGSAPREPSKEGSLSGEPAKSVRPRRAKPEGSAQPAREPTSDVEPDLPPLEERRRLAAELRAQLLGAQAPAGQDEAERTNGHDVGELPLELLYDTQPDPEDA